MTLLPMQLASAATKIGSMCTAPVKVEVGWRVGVEGEWEEEISCILGGGMGWVVGCGMVSVRGMVVWI